MGTELFEKKESLRSGSTRCSIGGRDSDASESAVGGTVEEFGESAVELFVEIVPGIGSCRWTESAAADSSCSSLDEHPYTGPFPGPAVPGFSREFSGRQRSVVTVGFSRKPCV